MPEGRGARAAEQELRREAEDLPAARGAPPVAQGTARASRSGNRKPAARFKEPRFLHAVIILAATIPFLWAAAAFASDLWRGTSFLTAEPITELEHFTGKWTLRFLGLTLAITPLIALTRLGWLIRYRRTFGLFAFFYACVHFTIYLTLDLELLFSEIFEDITERPYITIGFTALMLLVPLAWTSTKGWIRRLGGKRWNALHRLVYVSSVLGVIHFWMSVKRDLTSPILFALLFATLLGWRVWRAIAERSAARARAGGS
jgi:methionine sulfoxide reductase heme-binding subunit